MPPWKPDARKGDFENERRLTDAELDTLQRWIAARRRRRRSPPISRRPEMRRRLAARHARPRRAHGRAVHRAGRTARCVPHLRDSDSESRRALRAGDRVPARQRARRASREPRRRSHAVVAPARSRAIRSRDTTGSMVREARYPEGQLLGWTPGQAPHASPDGMQWRLDPGSDLVVQLHLQPTGKPEPLQLSVGLFFTDTPPARSPVGLRLGSETIDIPAGDRAHVITDRYVLPVDVDVVAMQPHAHNLARRMEANATLPDGATRPLIAIDDWDFRWQDVYRYAHAVRACRRARRSRCVTPTTTPRENPRNPHQPPVRVVWGQNTTDEMGDLWLQVCRAVGRGHRRLAEDVRRKARAEDLAAYTKLLRRPTRQIRCVMMRSRHLYLEGGQHRRGDRRIPASRFGSNRDPRRRTTTSGSRCPRAGGANRRCWNSRKRCASTPTTRRPTTISARCCTWSAHRAGPRALSPRHRLAPGQRPGARESRPPAVGAGTTGRGDGLAPERADADARFPPALAGLAWIRATAADAALRNADEAVASVNGR